MTSLELLKEIEAWLSFNTEPSKEQTAKLRNSIKQHVTEQLRIHDVSGQLKAFEEWYNNDYSPNLQSTAIKEYLKSL